jgi:hypothetical protein
MHELEEASKELLGHFIQGHPRNIRSWRQALTATWAVKTALVWDYVSPEDRTIPAAVLTVFRALQRPSMRQQVWIGRFSDAAREPHSFQRTAGHVIGEPRPDKPGEAHGYLAALSIGELTLVVCGHVLDIEASFQMPSQFAAQLAPIWPLSMEVVSWPPSDPIGHAGLE